ncbi:MAG TPA: DUF3108 domain-containing protein [Usitatibacter sp.]|nr:DUF3108 domain-containing protein [Usitatibacter sp.]
MPLAQILRRHRLVLLALGVSLAAHTAVFVGVPGHAKFTASKPAEYVATLSPRPMPAPSAGIQVPAPLPVSPLRRASRKLAAAPALLPAGRWRDAGANVLASNLLSPIEQMPQPLEQKLVLAEEVALLRAEPDPFPVEGLPQNLSISYQITSALADGRAIYNWEREGSSYRITGEAEAEGFFTLFLEGRVLQESRGTLTAGGLRPDRFEEQRPNHVREGLEFDWRARQVTFARGDDSRTSALEDNTVDWLSMIFQLAHVPPSGTTLPIQVFTQRKMYRYKLAVLGVEEIDIPLGKLRALHLRHVEPGKEREAVDVWLGIEQHYLPVKMRFPVARNRLMVDQVATRISASP